MSSLLLFLGLPDPSPVSKSSSLPALSAAWLCRIGELWKTGTVAPLSARSLVCMCLPSDSIVSDLGRLRCGCMGGCRNVGWVRWLLELDPAVPGS